MAFLVWTIMDWCLLVTEKKILVLCEDAYDGLDDAIMRERAKYLLNVSNSRKIICSGQPYKALSSIFWGAGAKLFLFKALI